MKRLIPILVLLLLISNFGAAAAQESPEFETVFVSVWPEYDNQENLVIIQFQLSPKTTLPAKIDLPLPSGVSSVWTVAVGDSFETVVDRDVVYTVENGVLSINAMNRYVHIEYYDQLKKTGSERSYDFVWQDKYSVSTFSFEFKQPLKSSDVQVIPAMSSSIMDPEGFIVSSNSNLTLKDGEPTTISISYKRDTDEPSTSFMKIATAPTAVSQTDNQTNWIDYLPWVIGGLGLIFVIIAGYVFFNTGVRSAPAPRKRHSGSTDHEVSSGDQIPVYCPQCGKRASPGDKFCRVCGEKIRQ